MSIFSVSNLEKALWWGYSGMGMAHGASLGVEGYRQSQALQRSGKLELHALWWKVTSWSEHSWQGLCCSCLIIPDNGTHIAYSTLIFWWVLPLIYPLL